MGASQAIGTLKLGNAETMIPDVLQGDDRLIQIVVTNPLDNSPIDLSGATQIAVILTLGSANLQTDDEKMSARFALNQQGDFSGYGKLEVVGVDNNIIQLELTRGVTSVLREGEYYGNATAQFPDSGFTNPVRRRTYQFHVVMRILANPNRVLPFPVNT